MRVVLIVNPKAKRGRALLSAQSAQERLCQHGWKCQLLPSQNADHVRWLTQEAMRKGVDAIVVCGGDGTIHQAIQVLAYSETPLGIIPCGRGNDLARALGIPLNASDAADIIAQQHTKAIDLGQVKAMTNAQCPMPNAKFFCGIVTCGFDSEVADFAHRHQKIPGGWVGYLGVALLLLARYRFREVHLEGNGVSFAGRILLAATANCPAYGGGMWIAPTAKLDDGLLHVCIVRETSKLRVLKMLPTVFTGKHVREPEVSVHPVKAVSLEANEPLPLFADGEPVGTTPAHITVAPSAISVFMSIGSSS